MNRKNLLVVHGGGPTAVMNASLGGVIEEAKRHGEIGAVYAAAGGTGGLLGGRLFDLRQAPQEELALLPSTPASAIGTSRDHLDEADYAGMLPILDRYEIGYVLLNGGNGTMDTCGRLCRAANGRDISVVGIPKTMDNDLAVTDHSPGYGSAARFLAGSVAEVCADVRGLPIHVVVIEALGRNAGWVTAAASLAADCGAGGPDLIYLPEVPFEEERFLADVGKLVRQKGGGVVVASEGLRGGDGKPIVEPVFSVGRATYFGDVSAHLARLITEKLGYKSRAEKPGLLGRASIAWQSPLDRDEAAEAGRVAVRAALAGQTGRMVAIRRLPGPAYRAEFFLADIEDVMLTEKKMPASFIDRSGCGVTEEFREWCRPLLGGPLPRLCNLGPWLGL